MNTHADKTQENKSQSMANTVSNNQSGSESTFQFVDNRPEAIAQRKLQEMANNSSHVQQAAQLQAMANNYFTQQQQPLQKKENNTGLPDNLKSGIENLSGFSLDDVKVHRNSDKPAQLHANAYAQGTNIHLGPGQEKHLPHEAWHVVQQKQGRVKPTIQMKGKVNINDDAGLEKEADAMGAKALEIGVVQRKILVEKPVNTRAAVAQRMQEAGQVPVIDIIGPGVANPGVTISGLINCVGVVAKIYAPAGGMNYIAVAGGHFVTPDMYDFAAPGFTPAGDAFIAAIQALVAGYPPGDIEWEFYVKASAVEGTISQARNEAGIAANAIRANIGAIGPIVDVSGDVVINI